MKVKAQQNKEKSEATLRVEVTAGELLAYLRQAAKELSDKNPLKGFRPGKAPLKVVQEAFGHERVLNMAMEKAVPRFFVTAVLEESVEAIDRPKVVIEELGEERGLVFTATVAVLPEVTLGDFSALNASKKSVEVKDDEVEQELKHLATTRSTYLDVARPAQTGDTVIVDFSITMNGELMEGGESKNHPVHLGEGHFVPDFEKHLAGMSAGDTREFPINFPADFARESLRRKQAQAAVKAHAVQKRVLPAIDDAFANQLGEFKDLAALKYALKSNLIAEREQRETERRRAELSEQLAAAATFAQIPVVLINREIDRRVQELTQMLTLQPAYAEATAGKRKGLNKYLADHGKTYEQLREELRPAAEQSVKVGLALRQLAETQQIEASEEEITARVNSYLTAYASTAEAKKKIDLEELKENVTSMLRNQKTLEKLEELAG